jgi:alpha-L-arabinofuranosidase
MSATFGESRVEERREVRKFNCRATGLRPSLIGYWLFGVTLALPWNNLDAADSAQITIHANEPGARINPAMWGVFFEDINLGADGGLYAELVKNRSFEFPDPLMGWSQVDIAGGTGSMMLQDNEPFNPANPHYLRLTSRSKAGFGVANEGFRGIGIREGETYDFSAQVRAHGSNPKALRLELVAPDGHLLASSRITRFESAWKKRKTTLHAHGTEPKARLNLVLEGPGTLDLDMVSLFPRHTWKNRPGGLRADLVQMLADLRPGFVRFPGGCIVEGRYLTNRYQWKNTLGALEERKLIINRWNDEFKHKPTPDYYQSFGLGFFEFFQLCEDIGAEPLPILNCGMACQFNSSELAPLDQLDSYVRDALDLVEFANGPASSPWGARRAAMGHRAPFRLRMLGVGNEQWGPQYFERYARFAKALKQAHPEIQLVSSAGPSPADERFQLAWTKLRELGADIVDEHCYAAPTWFLENANRYDHYDRQGPKVFMGEYAAQSVAVVSPDNRNTLECALAEAAYMTGLERNADVVRMASYAPLFAHVDGWQWTPDLIWCDNLRVYGTPDYYVQQLFCRNRGDLVLTTQIAGAPKSGSHSGLYATAAAEEKTGQIILKVVNPAPSATEATVQLDGATNLRSKGEAIVLAGTAPAEQNSLADPRRISPLISRIEGVGPKFRYTFLPYSFTVLRLSTERRH